MDKSETFVYGAAATRDRGQEAVNFFASNNTAANQPQSDVKTCIYGDAWAAPSRLPAP
jgi:hypothetical protein